MEGEGQEGNLEAEINPLVDIGLTQMQNVLLLPIKIIGFRGEPNQTAKF